MSAITKILIALAVTVVAGNAMAQQVFDPVKSHLGDFSTYADTSSQSTGIATGSISNAADEFCKDALFESACATVPGK